MGIVRTCSCVPVQYIRSRCAVCTRFELLTHPASLQRGLSIALQHIEEVESAYCAATASCGPVKVPGVYYTWAVVVFSAVVLMKWPWINFECAESNAASME